MSVTVFVDTNYFLHHRSIDDVDWVQQFGTKDVAIAAAAIVIREATLGDGPGVTPGTPAGLDEMLCRGGARAQEAGRPASQDSRTCMQVCQMTLEFF